MQHKSPFPQQTHFIGVLPPVALSETLESSRRYMREVYGCKSGQTTPIHITLVPPFRLPAELTTDDLCRAIASQVLPHAAELSFTATVDGYDAFGDRTIFARVAASPEWTRLRDAVLSAVLTAAPACTKKDARPFQPHLTIANRDIPHGASTQALAVLNELALQEAFPVDNITIFERSARGWEIAGEMGLV